MRNEEVNTILGNNCICIRLSAFSFQLVAVFAPPLGARGLKFQVPYR